MRWIPAPGPGSRSRREGASGAARHGRPPACIPAVAPRVLGWHRAHAQAIDDPGPGGPGPAGRRHGAGGRGAAVRGDARQRGGAATGAAAAGGRARAVLPPCGHARRGLRPELPHRRPGRAAQPLAGRPGAGRAHRRGAAGARDRGGAAGAGRAGLPRARHGGARFRSAERACGRGPHGRRLRRRPARLRAGGAPAADGVSRARRREPRAGHRTPAIMVLGDAVGGRALPEGAAVVIEPAAAGPRPLGILAPVPLVGDGFHDC